MQSSLKYIMKYLNYFHKGQVFESKVGGYFTKYSWYFSFVIFRLFNVTIRLNKFLES